MGAILLMLPPRTSTTREWAERRAAALEAGEIAGAGLDVFETEPQPGDHPVWNTPGVLITPHAAGSASWF